MNDLKLNKRGDNSDDAPSQAIHTTLYELVEAVILSAGPNEGYLTGFIASHMLDSGNIRLSKKLSESIQ